VGSADLISLTALGELVVGVLADGLQHGKPGPPRGAVGDQQRLAHQRIQQIQGGELVVGVADRARTGYVESTREHRAPPQQSLLGVIKQVVGPCHRVAQRVVVVFPPASCSDQQPEPVISTRFPRISIIGSYGG